MRTPLRPVTHDEIETFERDGVVCLRGILSVAWLDRMAAAVEVAIGHHTSTDLTAMARRFEEHGEMVRRTSGAVRGRFIAGTDHWRFLPEFRAFACDSPLPEIAGTLLRASKVNLYEDSLLVKEPGAGEPTAFHQDLSYFHVEGTQVCTVWCPLDPVSRASGAVGYVRSSHRWPEVFRPNFFVSPTAIPNTAGEQVPDVAADPERYDVVYFDLEPGDLTVHHARTVHGAGGNTSATQRRRAISVRYCGDDARYYIRPGAPLKGHHQKVRNGDVLDSDDCPVVWRGRVS